MLEAYEQMTAVSGESGTFFSPLVHLFFGVTVIYYYLKFGATVLGWTMSTLC